LKPQNILYKFEGGINKWMLADFGSSSKKGTKLNNIYTVKYAYSLEYASIE
jgi:serine/threonine protein kinase